MGEYGIEFFLLLTQNKIKETDEQLVSQFIDSLRPQFQNILNLFDPITIYEAHQRALLIQRQNQISTVPWNQPTALIRAPATAPTTNTINQSDALPLSQTRPTTTPNPRGPHDFPVWLPSDASLTVKWVTVKPFVQYQDDVGCYPMEWIWRILNFISFHKQFYLLNYTTIHLSITINIQMVYFTLTSFIIRLIFNTFFIF